MTTTTIETQRCSMCKKHKPIECFPFRPRYTGQRYKVCPTCLRKSKQAVINRNAERGFIPYSEPLPEIPPMAEYSPCPHPPGTSLRQAWMASRRESGISLWHPLDSVRDDDERSFVPPESEEDEDDDEFTE